MMLHVCYMSGQHITWLNPFAQRQLSHIMLEGYMFFLIAKGGCERRVRMIHLASDFVDGSMIHSHRSMKFAKPPNLVT